MDQYLLPALLSSASLGRAACPSFPRPPVVISVENPFSQQLSWVQPSFTVSFPWLYFLQKCIYPILSAALTRQRLCFVHFCISSVNYCAQYSSLNCESRRSWLHPRSCFESIRMTDPFPHQWDKHISNVNPLCPKPMFREMLDRLWHEERRWDTLIRDAFLCKN